MNEWKKVFYMIKKVWYIYKIYVNIYVSIYVNIYVTI
jgi:hypothetical protein